MTTVIGVRFREAGKIYYFDPGEFSIARDEHVIVETARGLEYGTVVLGNTQVADEKVVSPLKPVLRKATAEDDEIKAEMGRKEKDAFAICQEKIRARELEMKLIDAEYTFDGNKVLFYFTADGRVDFRELVKDLAAVFRTRIELRQIGVRDETKILGGIGICGRPLCCHTFLSEFAPVSIKMAKEQNLSLNPTKISGTCGRLMCCLKNEEETYEYLNSRLPGVGDKVITSEGYRGEVSEVNVLRQRVKVLVHTDGDEKELQEYPVEDLKFRPRRKKGHDKKAGEEAELTEEEKEFEEALKKAETLSRKKKSLEESLEGSQERRGGREGGKPDRKEDGRGKRENGKGGKGSRNEGSRGEGGKNAGRGETGKDRNEGGRDRSENRNEGGRERGENRSEGSRDRGEGRNEGSRERGEGRNEGSRERGEGRNEGNRERGENRNEGGRDRGERRRDRNEGRGEGGRDRGEAGRERTEGGRESGEGRSEGSRERSESRNEGRGARNEGRGENGRDRSEARNEGGRERSEGGRDRNEDGRGRKGKGGRYGGKKAPDKGKEGALKEESQRSSAPGEGTAEG